MTNIFKYIDLINDRVPVKSIIDGHLGYMSRLTCICFDSVKKIEKAYYTSWEIVIFMFVVLRLFGNLSFRRGACQISKLYEYSNY